MKRILIIVLLFSVLFFMICFYIDLTNGQNTKISGEIFSILMENPDRIIMMPERHRVICYQADEMSKQGVICGEELSGGNKGWFWLYRLERTKDYSKFWDAFKKLKKVHLY